LATQKQKQNLPTIKQLLETGAHFGHQTHRWNPEMKMYIFGARNGIHILDLSKTLKLLEVAQEMCEKTVSERRSILFVGTKKAAKSVVRECAENCGEFYTSERWLGGTLTNLITIRKSVRKLEIIEKKISTGGENLTKKELSLLAKDQIKLDRNLSGIRAMKKTPGLLIIVDPTKESIAVQEAKKLNIPVIALIDTNCNPNPIDFPIPCNDDAQRSVKLILDSLCQTIIDKKNELDILSMKEDSEDEEESLPENLEAIFTAKGE